MAPPSASNQDDPTNKNGDYCWYFAIGSMMLPQSYELRGFQPVNSLPAELFGYKMAFFGPMGFAEAKASTEGSMHGVLHQVTAAQMVELDKIEVGYIRQTGRARPYGPNFDPNKIPVGEDGCVEATVYCRPEGADDPTLHQPPRQRYIEILTAGAQHFDVDPDYIKMLQQSPCVPRTQPCDFVTFGAPPEGSPEYDEVPPSTDDAVYFSLNGRVFECTYPKNNPHGNFVRHMIATHGPHWEVGYSKLALDRKYGVPTCLAACTPEHSAYMEDMHYRFINKHNEVQYHKVIGTFRPQKEYVKQEPSASSL